MKNKKLSVSLIGLVFLLVFFTNISNGLNSNNSHEISQGELINIDFPIHIKDNWSETIDLYDWCTGNGTEDNPYIIQGINVTNKQQTAHLSIETAEYFIIRNCVISNYSKPYGHHIFAGIYIEKGEYGLIDNCTIINCSHGISLAEAKDDIKITNCKFIGSHNNSDTGLGCAILIHEAKGVNISYNDIYNYYSGIVVYDAEEIYIDNNRIETSFRYISDTGIYFYGVNNSAIINNDFYGCNFTGHEYDDPFISFKIDDLKTSFTNCYNITVYGNRFFDLDGNLIDGLDDLIEDPIVNIPNYWLFIISGVIIIAIIVIVLVVLIKRFYS